MENFFDKRLKQIIFITFILLSLFLLVKTAGDLIDISSKAKVDNKTSHTITFTGNAQVAAVPDVAEFVVTVREVAMDVSKAQQNMTQKVNKLIDLFAKIGIDKKDIQTKSYSTNPQYHFVAALCVENNCGSKERVITGYEARESVSVKLRDITKSGDVLTQIAKLKISEVKGPNFSVSDESKFKLQAQEEAILDAKSKAKTTAKNLGITLGKIVSFSETPQFRRNFSAMAMTRGDGDLSPEIETGEKMVQSRVSISFEIE